MSHFGRGGRVVECTGLENRRAREGLVSSNLTRAVRYSIPFPFPKGPTMRTATLFLLALLPAAPLAAQFEGTITMKMSDPAMGTESIQAYYDSTGVRLAMGMTAPASAAPLAAQEFRMLFNPSAQKMTMLMTVAGEMAAMTGGAKGIKMDMDLKDRPTDNAK